MLHKITFEIYDITTGEVLANNLSFDDMPELLQAYSIFYPTHRIEPCYRVTTIIEEVHLMPRAREEFTHDWFEMLDDIIDNLYNS